MPEPLLPSLPEDQDQLVEVEGSGDARLLRRQNSLPPKYDDVFPGSLNENYDSTPSAPPVQFDLVPIRTRGLQRQSSNNSNGLSMI